MRENLQCLGDLLGDKPFLLGKYVTLADIAVFAQLAWMQRYDEQRLIGGPRIPEWMVRLGAVEEIAAAIKGVQPALATPPAAARARA
jgi:glutathione S-transferase